MMKQNTSLAIVALSLMMLSTRAFADCDTTTPVGSGVHYILDIQPEDEITDVFCRLQRLKGEYKLDVAFFEIPYLQNKIYAHRTTTINLNGTPWMGKDKILNFIEEMIPKKESVIEDGNDYTKIFDKTIQLQTPKTPDDQYIGLPPKYEPSKRLAIWSPIALRIKPLKQADIDFELVVTFRPSVGRMLEITTGSRRPTIFRVWKGLIANSLKCPSRIPTCGGLPDIVDVDTAWTIDAVFLQSIEGQNRSLSNATIELFNSFAQANDGFIIENTMPNFIPTVGEALFSASDGIREVRAKAMASPSNTSGTSKINVLWREKSDAKLSYRNRLEEWGRTVRQNILGKFG